MTDTCPTGTNPCGCQKGYRRALVAILGSGYFLFLAVNALMVLANRHMNGELPWNRDSVIDAVSTAAMAVFALAVLADSVRSFRRGSLGKLAFFGVLMVWSIVLAMVLFYVALLIVPKIAV